MTNIDPTPGSLVHVMSPPCATKIVRAIDKTQARAPHLARPRLVDAKEPIEHARHGLGGNADAGVDDLDARRRHRIRRVEIVTLPPGLL